MMSLIYLKDISFKDLAKMYYGASDIIDYDGYFTICEDRVRCMEYAKNTNENMEYFTVMKSSKKTNVKTQNDIIKKVPEIVFPADLVMLKLKLHLEEGYAIPNIQDIISDIRDKYAKEKLTSKDIEMYELIHGWSWKANSLAYPSEVTFEEIIKLYYPDEIVKAVGKVFIIERLRVYCCEKFVKLPKAYENYVEIFTLMKTSSKENVITRQKILKKIPNLIFEEPDNNLFEQLITFVKQHNRIPTKEDNEKLYQYVKEYCLAYHKDSTVLESDVEKFESIPGWYWDYERLTRHGQKYEAVIDRCIKRLELSPEQERTKKTMLQNFHEGKVSTYFENRIREAGLNIQI